MASNNDINFSNPHTNPLPPPTPVSPPSPDNHPTVIIVVVVSFGCLFLLAAFMFCIWCLFKRRCKQRKLIHERKDVDMDEHLKVQEMVIPGPHGPRTVVLNVEDELRVHEDIHKSEVEMVGKGKHAETKEGSVSSLEVEASSSQQLNHPEHLV